MGFFFALISLLFMITAETVTEQRSKHEKCKFSFTLRNVLAHEKFILQSLDFKCTCASEKKRIM